MSILALATLGVGATSAPSRARAESGPEARHWVGGRAGYAVTKATDGSADGEGGWLAGEYAYVLSSWFQLGAYAGSVLTFSERGDEDCVDEPANRRERREQGTTCEVSAQIGFLGGKGRLIIPIPFVAPFFEFGLGPSIGALHTRTSELREQTEGVSYHLLAVVGVAFGADHEFELAFSFLSHPAERQGTGMFGLGFMFAVGD
jgi:hypothetical protein